MWKSYETTYEDLLMKFEISLSVWSWVMLCRSCSYWISNLPADVEYTCTWLQICKQHHFAATFCWQHRNLSLLFLWLAVSDSLMEIVFYLKYLVGKSVRPLEKIYRVQKALYLNTMSLIVVLYCYERFEVYKVAESQIASSLDNFLQKVPTYIYFSDWHRYIHYRFFSYINIAW